VKPREKLRKVGDFLVEVGQGGFQRFAVIGVRCGVEIVGDARARQLQLLNILLAKLFLRTFGVAFWRRFGDFLRFDLRFYVFAFPASGHRHIF